MKDCLDRLYIIKIYQYIVELNTIKYTLSYALSQVFKTLDQIILKFPDEKLNFKPHEKSMSAGHLSCHVNNMLIFMRLAH